MSTASTSGAGCDGAKRRTWKIRRLSTGSVSSRTPSSSISTVLCPSQTIRSGGAVGRLLLLRPLLLQLGRLVLRLVVRLAHHRPAALHAEDDGDEHDREDDVPGGGDQL